MREKIFYAEHFYNKVSKDSEALKKNANDFPFSSLAGFLLLYHYKKTSHPDFERMAKKMALLFNNEYWLQFQLHDTMPQIEHQQLVSSETEELSNKSLEFNRELSIETSNEENFIEEPVTGLLSQEINNGEDESNNKTNEEAIEVTSEISQEESIEKKTSESGETEITTKEAPVLAFNKAIEADDDNSAAAKDQAIAFEPLHTVDYFASQGIKISDELLQNDKLGSQMKSFTEWLRSMKKIHPSKLEEQGLATEKLIQHASNESNINTEILTEAMAEVLIKQDKKEKAIEMFSKLSLINPSKSAYFAARIESIKSI